MNNSYLLKKQLQENEEELSNYLRDMNIWQKEMKRKEYTPSIKNVDDRKKPKIGSTKTDLDNVSCNYSTWDKFDADKACEELDLQDDIKKNYKNSSTDNRLKNQQSEGLYEKNLGNALVQKQKWSEAILRYTRAIDYYDKDPIFYANRALCYLKTNEFQRAINDCTSSLKLDNTYVKTYQRRSAAYMALGMYNEAINDLNEILKLEPNNKQAKLDMEVMKNKTKQSTVQNNSKIKFQKSNLMNQQTKNGNSILCKDNEKPLKSVVPNWPLRAGCKQIITKQKPPHLRSKKPLSTPKIKNIQVDQEECDNIYLLQTTLKEVCGKNDQFKENNDSISPKNDLVSIEKTQNLVVPPTPQTYVQLKQDWAYLQKDSKLLCQYLKQIPGKCLPSIVRNSMDNDLFVDILRILKLEFIQNNNEVIEYLKGISRLPRLQMLVMFCSDNEMSCIKELLNHASKFMSENDYKNLKNSFGL